MSSRFDEISEEIEEQIDELVEDVLNRGPVALTGIIEILDSTVVVRMPTQLESENAMDAAGRDARGRIRDGMTRDIVFSRNILAKAIVEINGVPMTEQMSEKFLAKIQPTIVSVLMAEFANLRMLQSQVIQMSLNAAKKSQPDPNTE